MAQNSAIQWTDHTWNIARGCTKVDADCKFCYMMRDGDRYKYNGKVVVRTKTVFKMPLRIKEPSRIFTCSLTDFFHEDIDSYRDEAWAIIRRCPQHAFQILTKRPERAFGINLPPDWGTGWKNVWLGTSIGSQDAMNNRLFKLYNTTAKTKFLSLEPLHGLVVLPDSIRENIDWVILGGESGNETGKWRYRPCELWWLEQIVRQCLSLRVPVFVKQLGTHLSKKMGLKDRHGGDINEWPEYLRVRQFPK